jgi:hypothetical protein
MRRIKLLIGSLLLSATAVAQYDGVADSVFSYQPITDRYHLSMQSVAGMVLYPIKNTGKVSLSGMQETGGFRTAQTPQQHSVIGFDTEGNRTLGKFKVYGNFSFSRVWDDSLAWSQGALSDLSQPYYFAAQKAGQYIRQVYHMNGRVAYTLVADKLFVGAGIDYLYNTAVRKVDPRPSVKNLSVIAQPDIAFKTGRHLLGLTVNIGYGDENAEVSYTSTKYQNNLELYPERTNWLMMGMGYMQPRTSEKSEITDNSRLLGLTVSDVFTGEKWTIHSRLQWDQQRARFMTDKSNSLAREQWGLYTTQTYQFEMQAQQGVAHNLHLRGRIQNGDDYNTYKIPNKVDPLNGTNYTYRGAALQLGYDHLAENKRGISPGWGATIDWRSEAKNDHVTSHQLEYATISPTLNGGIYGRTKQGDKFQALLTAGMQFPLSQQVGAAPTQFTAFTTDVLYHDYYYWSATYGKLALAAQYSSIRLLHTMPVAVSAQVNYLQRLNGKTPELAAVPLVGSYRLNYGLTLHLFL